MKGKILFEGRYDSLTKTIVDDLMVFFKKTKGLIDDIQYVELPYDKNGDEYYTHESGLYFNVDLIVNRTDESIFYGEKEIPYHIHTYIAEDDTLVVELTINDTYGEKYYQEIFYKLNEDIRHEIEHYLQNIFPDRQKPLIPNTAKYESTFEHHMDPSEVEALVYGFYRRAKLEKKPIDVVMLDDLNKDVEVGNITRDEAQELLKKWVIFSKRRLPDAIYSK